MLSRSQVRRAGDREEAIAAYREREGAVLGTHHEVVLFYGESEDDLRRTHARYFDIAVMAPVIALSA